MDFYQAAGAVEPLAVRLARRVMDSGGRLLVVAEDEELRVRIGQALWQAEGTFLANGPEGGEHDARQPILIAAGLDGEAANGARHVVLADGVWRAPPETAERVFLIFDAETIGAARLLWRDFARQPDVERHFWRQEAGRWTELA